MRACAQGLRSPPKKSYAKRPLNQPFKAGWTFPDCGMGGWEAAFFWSPGPFLKPLDISEAKTCQWIFQNCFILNLSIYIFFLGGGMMVRYCIFSIFQPFSNPSHHEYLGVVPRSTVHHKTFPNIKGFGLAIMRWRVCGDVKWEIFESFV